MTPAHRCCQVLRALWILFLWATLNTDSYKGLATLFVTRKNREKKLWCELLCRDWQVSATQRDQVMKLCGLTASLFFLCFCLFFAVCGQCFYIHPRFGLSTCGEQRGTADQSLHSSVLSCHYKKKKTQTGLLSQNVTLIFHQRRQKRREEMPRFLVFVLLCNYEWEPLSMPTTLLQRHFSHQNVNILMWDFTFCCSFSPIWFQYYLLFTQVWCVMQTLESAVLALIRLLIFLKSGSHFASSATCEKKGTETYQHFCHFRVNRNLQ